jgi:hypothetical protein
MAIHGQSHESSRQRSRSRAKLAPEAGKNSTQKFFTLQHAVYQACNSDEMRGKRKQTATPGKEIISYRKFT